MVLPSHKHLFSLFLPLLFVSQVLANRWPGWVVDQSPPEVGVTDMWWTGCQNRTSSGEVSLLSALQPRIHMDRTDENWEQENTTVAYTVTQQACLDWYWWGGLKDTWQGMMCNGMGFFRGSKAYSDAAACYEKCYGCLSQSIQAGSIDAICRDSHGRGALDLIRGKDDTPSE
ncbi:MAG: hypothetical protein LQ346_005814 [Caloplaca aetnensis]|nr:MAG: hypothetical protein LQ346_005814 [Caloplaca aetnensis]